MTIFSQSLFRIYPLAVYIDCLFYSNCILTYKQCCRLLLMDLSSLLLDVGSLASWSTGLLDKVLNLKKYRVTDADTAALLIKIVFD